MGLKTEDRIMILTRCIDSFCPEVGVHSAVTTVSAISPNCHDFSFVSFLAIQIVPIEVFENRDTGTVLSAFYLLVDHIFCPPVDNSEIKAEM